MDIIKELQLWYQSQCDGDWEHSFFAVEIGTIDNPGWKVKINLLETDLESESFDSFKEDRSELDWIDCRVEDNKFLGFGGVHNLEEILSRFIKWAKSQKSAPVLAS